MSSSCFGRTLPSSALVESHDFPDTGRGLRCKRPVSKGEELVVVPLDKCWHAAAARASPELDPVWEAGVELSDFDASVLQLLIERRKGASSVHAVHLDELPKTYNSTLFWSTEELQELQGSPWHGLAKQFSEEAATDWQALNARLKEASTPSCNNLLEQHGIVRDDYLWAYATLKSRAAEVQVGGVKGIRLMAPGFDLFNHWDGLVPGTTHYFDEERRALVAVASKGYAEGEQAFISYGAASNGSLLLAGGFVLPQNRFDSVEVRQHVHPKVLLCLAFHLSIHAVSAP